MLTSRTPREIFVPYAVPDILPETQLELDALAAADPADPDTGLPPRQPGDVQDGSVDYYDYDWGDGIAPQEETIFSGCREGDTSYTGCEGWELPCSGSPCEPEPEPPEPEPPEPCTPEEAPQQDDPGYDTVSP